jgi:hypothetical protein
VAGSTKNAYVDVTAKSVGYAYLNGIVAQYSNPYWKPLTDSTKILSGDFVQQVTAMDIGGVSGNGFIYTGTSAPFNITYRIDNNFGLTTWSVASETSINDRWNTTNICRTRGMLLPTYSESTLGNVGGTGVPTHPSGNTMVSSTNPNTTSNYWQYNGFATIYYDPLYVRCIR